MKFSNSLKPKMSPGVHAGPIDYLGPDYLTVSNHAHCAMPADTGVRERLSGLGASRRLQEPQL